ncbi:molybdopterin synthase sulfur carrier subunit-like [Acipenser oxyrinchus oxyrinchus]|uniref:Molybdopterin synthase sulfur carrier subunit n=1 Tax=Acipenser oxyrinchus oxyrinchus TaxID=40147 RepID=A0AAD8CGN3_ACIOX|nr:molybdopterin synthase sulfur carrier subunit-like [Acipenser oxyrinchus oxyrinchus]
MTTEVLVLYFAKSAELAEVRSENITVPHQVTSLQLWQELVRKHPRLAAIRDQVVLAVRQEYASLGDELLILHPGDEVAVIPSAGLALLRTYMGKSSFPSKGIFGAGGFVLKIRIDSLILARSPESAEA